MKNKKSILNYHLIKPFTKRSINPIDSDLIDNAAHMIQLVGTLVKYNSVNVYKPYLASSWKRDDSGKTWEFTLKKGLLCEDGTEINSLNYIRGLHLAFRNHAFTKDTPVFSSLEGWGNFFSNKNGEISGLKAKDEYTVRFEFSDSPEGVEFYLSMPYYGFYCASDFDENGKWKNNSKITSSGPYRLKRHDAVTDELVLELRQDWPDLENRDAPELVRIISDKNDSLQQKAQEYTIVSTEMDEGEGYDSRWHVLKGAKTVSGSLILNPQRKVFSDISFRRFFAEKIREKIKVHSNDFKWIFLSSKFYPFVSSERMNESVRADTKLSTPSVDETIKVIKFPLTNQREKFVSNLLDDLFREVGVKSEFAPRIESGYGHVEVMKHFRKTHDIYGINVDKGGAAIPGVVGMMFCSDLGAGFPDPSGRVCDLVKKYSGRDLTAEEVTKFGDEFENIIEEDAAVIPIIHRGQNWLYSSDLDLSALSPNITVPDFQLVKLK